MISRFFSFLSLLAFGAAVGFTWAVIKDKPETTTPLLTGALLAGMLWMLVDDWRGYRVRSWLRKGDLGIAPQISGWWGVVLDRARRLLRGRGDVAARRRRARDGRDGASGARKARGACRLRDARR